MYTDTHTHLYLEEFADDLNPDAVSRAISAGVDRMIFPNVDLSTVAPMKALASKYPETISMAMGLHPTEVNANWEDVLGQILGILGDGSEYKAVGEIGIDLYWDTTYAEEQMDVFDRQVDAACKHDLPIIIHCRNGLERALEVLSGHKTARGVFHSFGGTADEVETIRKTGDFYFGINGIVTFKNSTLKNALPAIGTEKLLLETDSPYLAPVPHRGKRNESAYLPLIAQAIADSLGTSKEDVAGFTTRNATELFRL